MPEPISMFASLARSFSSFSLKPPSSSAKLSSDDHDAVGLGIVAAMVTDGDESSRSEPISILPPANSTGKEEEKEEEEEEEDQQKQGEAEEEDETMEIDESSETYTCVTSYMGGEAVSRTVYFGLNAADSPIKITTAAATSNAVSTSRLEVVFYVSNSPLSSPEYAFPSDFLSRCYLCNKSLDGSDIFIYRGEKAFCGPECRYQYVLNDEHELSESCGSEVLMNLSDCAQSPCSSPLFSAGIAAA